MKCLDKRGTFSGILVSSSQYDAIETLDFGILEGKADYIRIDVLNEAM